MDGIDLGRVERRGRRLAGGAIRVAFSAARGEVVVLSAIFLGSFVVLMIAVLAAAQEMLALLVVLLT